LLPGYRVVETGTNKQQRRFAWLASDNSSSTTQAKDQATWKDDVPQASDEVLAAVVTGFISPQPETSIDEQSFPQKVRKERYQNRNSSSAGMSSLGEEKRSGSSSRFVTALVASLTKI